MIYLPHFDTGVPLFIMLHFIASQILFVVVGGGGGVFFNKLKFCVNLVLNKSMGTIFPGAFGHFVSLCYILLILTMLLTLLLLLLLIVVVLYLL